MEKNLSRKSLRSTLSKKLDFVSAPLIVLPKFTAQAPALYGSSESKNKVIIVLSVFLLSYPFMDEMLPHAPNKRLRIIVSFSIAGTLGRSFKISVEMFVLLNPGSDSNFVKLYTNDQPLSRIMLPPPAGSWVW